ncbi:MAG: type II toxin-antitoxin system RelE/ParE family toxin [Planctomycetia bacterium]|nr:type II toxin-antitoxin system RelE/ParE family toxin [Planctomycetia bacterium]
MNFAVLPVAELEGVEAAVWYDDRRLGLGDEFLDELGQVLERIQAAPASFASLEGYFGQHDVRRCLLKRFPYAVIFRWRPEEVLIVAVGHVRRRPFYWLDRLG